ncbi:MAG: adenosylcobalamin-dependent ribonucleoside-diphosphate reductase [Candidatus Thermoplasmatota archaeon]|nr:adenosylcobalamin-dependent ribonucleoside-diphosphate reductase [Candidatus Thermoplasmatota archaeon]MCL5988497.1 adenosylcobalamin-dependent ribonucleoside-diphosphate reductase [Candidatus Thermoplasmatota archaeon]
MRTTLINKIVKREGQSEEFDKTKITRAIYKAMLSVKYGTMKDAEQLTDKVIEKLESQGAIPTVEIVQDVVESVLMETSIDGKKFNEVAKAYILYREKRRSIRDEKKRIGVVDDLKLSLNAVKVLEARYLLKDEEGKIIETPRQMFSRVAKHVGIIDALYDYAKFQKSGKLPENGRKISTLANTQLEVLERAFAKLKEENVLKGEFSHFIDFVYTKPTSVSDTIEKMEDMMCNLEYVPNSPTMMNAGARLGQLSACFVLPVDDSIEGIFEAVKHTAEIHKSGGGTGFSFSRLRSKDDMVGSTKGVASGPVSFMKIFDTTTEVIKQGGKRRGANMGILRYDHPDIMEFITSKDAENTILRNFNISVGMEDEFFEKLDSDGYIDLKNPKNGKVVSRIKARTMWDTIITHAWRTADPGLIFLDEINRSNPVKNIADIEATNPCGEQPLMPYESCNLGSINLAKFVVDGSLDYDSLREIIKLSVRFLDNVVDANKFPVKEIEEMTRKTRKIGLGVMGFADMLILMGIHYDSEEALKVAENVMSFLNTESHRESSRLASERGVFPGWYGSEYERQGVLMRNSTTTTIAPTGTISIIAGCSSSIEPLFAIAFMRHVLNGQELIEVNPLFEEITKKRNIYTDKLMQDVAKTGNLETVEVSEDLKKLFVTSHEIEPEWHVLMQATFQKFCDSGVSKTINLPHDATPDDIAKSYRLAKDLHCKGITVYRDGSKTEQVLYTGTEKVEKKEKPAKKSALEIAEKITSEEKSKALETPKGKFLKLEATFDPACPDGKCDR